MSLKSVADPECARGGGVNHIWLKKGVLASLYSKKTHENAIFSPRKGGGVRRVRPMLDPPLEMDNIICGRCPANKVIEFGRCILSKNRNITVVI